MITIEELRKKYPIGTKVYPVHIDKAKENGQYFVVSTEDFSIDKEYCWAKTLSGDFYKGTKEEDATSVGLNRIVWSKRRGFAEIVVEGRVKDLFDV